MRKGIIKMGLMLVMALWMMGESWGQAPAVGWSGNIHGPAIDASSAIAVDAFGNTYLTGTFEVNTQIGPYFLSGAGSTDIFIAKYDPQGNVLWAKQVGGTADDHGADLVVDGQGNCFVTGWIRGSVMIGSTLITTNLRDIFVAKMDPAGNFIWVSQSNGSANEQSTGIGLDGAGNCYVGGHYGTPAGDALFGNIPLPGQAGEIFLVKYSPTGNLLWAKSAGGPAQDDCLGLAVDAAGNCYLTGDFRGPTGANSMFGSVALISNGTPDIYIAKFDASGNVLWAHRAGGSGYDVGTGIGLDGSGNSYICGYFYTTATFGSGVLTSYGDADVSIAKYDPNGNLIWAKQAGGINGDYSASVAVDAIGNCSITGVFSYSVGAPVNFGGITVSCAQEHCIAKYSPSGAVQWVIPVSRIGLSGMDNAIDAAGNEYITSGFFGSVFLGSNMYTSTGGTYDDVYIAKLGNAPLATPSPLSAFPFTLSPNPARSLVRLTNLMQPSRCTLYNLLGQPVVTQVLVVSATEATLPLQGLAPGLYTLQVQSAGGIKSVKLVVE